VKEILDTIILIMFVIMVAMFIINFNRQQIKKYTDKIEENENKNSNKDKINE
jgi:preprotein translocase subunit YajC